MLSRFGHIRLCVTLWAAIHQAPLSTGFSRQEYWSGLPFPSPALEGRGFHLREVRERNGVEGKLLVSTLSSLSYLGARRPQ